MKQEKNIWEQSRVELFQKLDCRETGLSQEDAALRLLKYGANELHAGKQKSILQIFLGQFADFLVLILILAAVISACMGDVESMIVILAVITMNAILGTVQTVKASASLDSLKQMSAPTAKVLRDGQIVQIPGREVVPGDVVILEAGDSVCADGRLLECASLKCAESALTGESLPVEKDTEPLTGETALGDRKNMVFSGSFVTYGRARFLVTSTGMHTEMGRIAALLKSTEEKKTPLQVSLDQFGRKLSIGILVICALLFAVSVFLRGENVMNAFLFAVALAVAAIPEALSSIVTIVLSFGTRKMAKENAIIRHLQAVEGLGSVSVICSDKTGTLTVGKPRVTAIHPATGISESELLTLAAAVEQGATHPLAQAIVREAQVAELAIPTAESQRALVGSGIEAQVNGERVLICAAGKHPADAFTGLINELESAGQTVVLVVRNDDVLGVIALQDTLRADAATAISELNALGVKGVILTGDNPRAAAAIAGELGLEFKAGLLPEDKVKAVTELNQHAPLAMVGDGINDAPAMKAAAIGIAMGSGTDVALETADAALTHNHLRGLVQMIELARATHANIRQNITIALGLKGIFLVTTLLGMTGLWLAVLADTGATVLVTANALRLLRRR